MQQTQKSRKQCSSSFSKFVHRLQRTFSTKNMKSSTPIVQQQSQTKQYLPPQMNSTSIAKDELFKRSNYRQCHLSQILYDPSRQVEYLSEIEEKSNSSLSEGSLFCDVNDSCYDSMSDHRHDEWNLSQMNVSNQDFHDYQVQPAKHLKLPSLLDLDRFHSTAIHEIGDF